MSLSTYNTGLGPAGALGLKKLPSGPVDFSLRHYLKHAFPQRGLEEEVNRWRIANMPHLWRGLRRVGVAQALGLPVHFGILHLQIIRPEGPGRLIDQLLADYTGSNYHPLFSFPAFAAERGLKFHSLFMGLASLRVVTTAGVGFLVDAFQNSTEMENLIYHGLGTGTTAENVSDTGLETELTTQYVVNSTRATGSATEGASANIFRSVGTNTVDASVAITEHALMSQAATGGGVCWDRTVFSANNLTTGESLQSTYDGTFTAGS